MSSLPLASSDEDRVPVVVIRKAARTNVRAHDFDALVPSLAEQRARRRHLRSLASDKRSGVRGAA